MAADLFAEVKKILDNAKSVTENGAIGYQTTGKALLDMNFKVSSYRSRPESEILGDFIKALAEDPVLALKWAFYVGDIREGLGERRLFRILIKYILQSRKDLIKYVGEFNRFDSLFVLFDTDAESEMIDFVKNQLSADMKACASGQSVSLLAKWMPSINTSSKETRALARKVCAKFDLSERTYRKTLSALRKHIGIVERLMSAGEWDKINFESVPSVAMSRYINTYNKRCQERFAEYKASLIKGEAKVNAATLYPYDIVMKWLNGGYYSSKSLDPVDEAQWKTLPNYVNESYDVVVMADVSGSMLTDNGRPMATSIGLATYFAQRNKGAYHGKYLTFTNTPAFINLNDNWTLSQCLDYVKRQGVGYSTNLDRAFEAIYNVAKACGEAPKALVVISDMEIDCWYSGDFCDSIASKWAKKYQASGLIAPKLILWNVESRGGRVLAQQSENVGFVSGYGVGPFANLTSLIDKSAYEAMVEILTQPQFTWK